VILEAVSVLAGERRLRPFDVVQWGAGAIPVVAEQIRQAAGASEVESPGWLIATGRGAIGPPTRLRAVHSRLKTVRPAGGRPLHFWSPKRSPWRCVHLDFTSRRLAV